MTDPITNYLSQFSLKNCVSGLQPGDFFLSGLNSTLATFPLSNYSLMLNMISRGFVFTVLLLLLKLGYLN